MKIVLGSKNRAKLRAVEFATAEIWPNTETKILGVAADSGVSDQPKSHHETRAGAINRARYALAEVPDAEIALGLEGGVEATEHGTFLFGWVAAMDKERNLGLGCTQQILLPEKTARRLMAGVELGEIMAELTGNLEISHEGGTFGVLTNDLLTRDTSFHYAILCALAPWFNPKIYE